MAISTADGSHFMFESAYLTSPYRDGMGVDISGYSLGVKLYETVIVPSATSATLYSFDWAGIDQLTFSALGGAIHPGYVDPYGQTTFAMDNFTFQSEATPEPATLFLFSGGFGALTLALRRCRRKSPRQ